MGRPMNRLTDKTIGYVINRERARQGLGSLDPVSYGYTYKKLFPEVSRDLKDIGRPTTRGRIKKEETMAKLTIKNKIKKF